MRFAPKQCYQISGGLRCNIVSVTPDQDDVVLIVQPDGEVPYAFRLLIQPIAGGPQHLVMASELCSLKPELVH